MAVNKPNQDQQGICEQHMQQVNTSTEYYTIHQEFIEPRRVYASVNAEYMAPQMTSQMGHQVGYIPAQTPWGNPIPTYFSPATHSQMNLNHALTVFGGYLQLNVSFNGPNAIQATGYIQKALEAFVNQLHQDSVELHRTDLQKLQEGIDKWNQQGGTPMHTELFHEEVDEAPEASRKTKERANRLSGEITRLINNEGLSFEHNKALAEWFSGMKFNIMDMSTSTTLVKDQNLLSERENSFLAAHFEMNGPHGDRHIFDDYQVFLSELALEQIDASVADYQVDHNQLLVQIYTKAGECIEFTYAELDILPAKAKMI